MLSVQCEVRALQIEYLPGIAHIARPHGVCLHFTSIAARDYQSRTLPLIGYLLRLPSTVPSCRWLPALCLNNSLLARLAPHFGYVILTWRRTARGWPSQQNTKAVGDHSRAIKTAKRALRFGAGSGSALPSAEPLSAPVPEPTTLVLAMFAAAGWCLTGRRGA